MQVRTGGVLKCHLMGRVCMRLLRGEEMETEALIFEEHCEDGLMILRPPTLASIRP